MYYSSSIDNGRKVKISKSSLQQRLSYIRETEQHTVSTQGASALTWDVVLNTLLLTESLSCKVIVVTVFTPSTKNNEPLTPCPPNTRKRHGGHRLRLFLQECQPVSSPSCQHTHRCCNFRACFQNYAKKEWVYLPVLHGQ